MSSQEKCEFCNKETFKYTCPKCNKPYCSVACYKSAAHLKCSEDFYKSCIQEHLETAEPRSHEDMQKIYEILKRIRESDAGVSPEDLDKDGLESLDSDDDAPADSEEEEEEEDIATRLQDIDINDADEVWQRLTLAERDEFKSLVTCGDIMKLLPDYKPWWCNKRRQSKIVEISTTSTEETPSIAIPQVLEKIPKLSQLCKTKPSLCVHYNLWNIMAAYACTVRFLGGEQQTNPSEAAAHIVNLSATLKYGTNFEDADDAITSVEMEALTTGNGSSNNSGFAGVKTLLVESREQLQMDARQLMSMQHYKLAALSDTLQLLQLAKRQLKSAKAEQADFQKLFAMCSGSVELNRTKLQQLAKKMEYFLAFVNSGDSEEIKPTKT